jgi:hypothetical protein
MGIVSIDGARAVVAQTGIDQVLSEILDEAIQALTVLDVDRLQSLEKRVSEMERFDLALSAANLRALLEKKRLLGLILQNCESNLDTLNRLHQRNMRNRWAH